MFIGMRLPPLRRASAASTARPITAKPPPTTPAAAAASTTSSSRGARGSTGWKRWPKPGTNFTPRSASADQLGLDRVVDRLAGFDAGGDRLVDLDALLAGAAMHVAQHVDRRGHGVVDADAAGRGHPGDGDRRRLRPVIDRRHQRRAQEISLALARQLAAQHQPDHRREADPADEILDRIAAIADHAGAHLDDRGRPPLLASGLVGGLAHIARSSRKVAISSAA